MKTAIILSLALFTSCALLSPSNLNKRQQGYLECAVKLTETGVKPEIIESLCDKAMRR